MSGLSRAIRAAEIPPNHVMLRAALLSAVVPATVGAILTWLVPQGCDIRGDPAFYRWNCLFPALLIPVAPVIAVLLPLALILNRRLGRWVPDGWLATILIAGIATQVVLVGSYGVMLGPAYVRIFFDDFVFLPQPFLAGAVAAGVFVLALGARRRTAGNGRSDASA